MWTALDHKSVAEMESALSTDSNDTCDAEYSDPDADRKWGREFMERVFSGPDYTVTPFEPDRMIMTPCGRLVFVDDKMGRGLVEASSGSKTDPDHPPLCVGPFRLTFMRKAGVWSAVGYGI
jgi:hypothetical protein